MRIAFFIAHPSQYYVFRDIMVRLTGKHEVTLIFFEKDIIKDLIEKDRLNIKSYMVKSAKRLNPLSSVLNFLRKEIQLYKLVKSNKVDLIVGTSIVIAHIAKLTGAKSIIFTEDDIDVIKLSARIGYPFCDNIVAPEVCQLGKWENKGIKYNGYQKLAYLNRETTSKWNSDDFTKLGVKKPFFLLRFSQLSAHHDVGIGGIDDILANNIVKILSKKGNVYITSERKISSELEPYWLKINPLYMHQVLSNAELFISDSQSMSVEASILGVPSIRFSDFAGRISVLEELENKYKLTTGIKTSEVDELYRKINELLSIPDLKEEYQKRRDKMLSEKINVVDFFYSLINNYK